MAATDGGGDGRRRGSSKQGGGRLIARDLAGIFCTNVLHRILNGILHRILHGVGGCWPGNRRRRGAPHVGQSPRFSPDVNRQIKAPARTKAKGLRASEAWIAARGRWKAAKGYGIGAWGWRDGWDARTGGGARERHTHRRSRRACPGVDDREEAGDVGP